MGPIPGKKNMRSSIFFSILIILLLGGCESSKPIRHLASDAALLTPGQTTKEEVIGYLGQPDAHRMLAGDTLEMVYFENKRSMFKQFPGIRSISSSDGYEMLRILVINDRVTECEFRAFDKNDEKWANDFSWDELQ